MSINEVTLLPGLTQAQDDENVNAENPFQESQYDVHNSAEELHIFYR